MDDATRTLWAFEQIRQLKYRYFRAVDCHDWALLAQCLSEDCRARLYGGKYAYDGREAFVTSLQALIGKPTFLTMHHGHHPELELLDDDRARGVWYLEDHAIDLESNIVLHGTALYDDEYIRRDGVWQIARTHHERIFESVTSPIPDSFSLTANRFQPHALA
ncbi:Bile acid 7-alpha dehydratase [Paraburkholderia caffeinitolerans]|uniref:Bile acid 7-alpha dehydratase n=1 Tax=Paraburkholderia caffeinitolerans TaxID=1723730 RepID=A0A6J5G6V5_9BURK|nr:nuclear transport factor 2 family protein [Paraburkholderia caffeinitolerans]CAB3794094.1 Bile acid 7-alpha dehydratase [Paraburkholderia caffeinitolerans]